MALMVQYDVPSSPLVLRSAPGQSVVAHWAQTHVGNHMIVHVGKLNFTFINTGNNYSVTEYRVSCCVKLLHGIRDTNIHIHIVMQSCSYRYVCINC